MECENEFFVNEVLPEQLETVKDYERLCTIQERVIYNLLCCDVCAQTAPRMYDESIWGIPSTYRYCDAYSDRVSIMKQELNPGRCIRCLADVTRLRGPPPAPMKRKNENKKKIDFVGKERVKRKLEFDDKEELTAPPGFDNIKLSVEMFGSYNNPQ